VPLITDLDQGCGHPELHGATIALDKNAPIPRIRVVERMSVAGASSFQLFGTFFPAWMLCALLGIVGSGAARAIFVGTGLSNVIPHQLLVCTGVGVIAATLAWLLSFGR
jgi:hypothetical protein